MKTVCMKADSPSAIETAARMLRSGEVVAIPTETVYGLAADALNPQAIDKIFAAKGRPRDNPLIVHVSSLEEIAPLVEKTDSRLPALAEKFWPGPLTVIMKKSPLVPAEVTAGLDTVAIRMPSHPAARAIIRAAGTPLAAPSANASGRPSPTSAEHVMQDLDGRIGLVIDGGRCEIGVESTVISLACNPPELLRPGGVTPDELREVLGEIKISHAVFEQLAPGEKPSSPGMKYKHYAPETDVTIVKGNFESYKKFVLAWKYPCCAVCFDGEGGCFEKSIEYGRSNSADEQAANIFDALRKVDTLGCDFAFVRAPAADGVGLAVYNRLLRSAAFRVADLDFTVPVYGLTGQTGAGKTTVGGMFIQRGFAVIDTDLIARRAVESGEVAAKLRAFFGADIYENGVLDRKKLAGRAFSSPGNTQKLNRATHPEITRLTLQEIHMAEKEGCRAVLIDAPVLFESPLTSICKKTVCVTAPEEVRLDRIMRRDSITPEQAKQRISAQRDENTYVSLSDYIIENSDLKQSEEAVDRFIKEEKI